MKNLISVVLSGITIVTLNSCGGGGDNPQDAVEEATAVDKVAFSDLTNHRLSIKEITVDNSAATEIIFCVNNKVKSGIFKDGDYKVNRPDVTMTFSSAEETLTELTEDGIFRKDESVLFNGSNYIIQAIHTAPFAVCN